jgi:hypothetical protein
MTPTESRRGRYPSGPRPRHDDDQHGAARGRKAAEFQQQRAGEHSTKAKGNMAPTIGEHVGAVRCASGDVTTPGTSYCG